MMVDIPSVSDETDIEHLHMNWHCCCMFSFPMSNSRDPLFLLWSSQVCSLPHHSFIHKVSWILSPSLQSSALWPVQLCLLDISI